MTKPSISLTELAEKGSDVDVLREMIQYVAQRLMDMDVEGRWSDGYGTRSPDRATAGNGTRVPSRATRSVKVDRRSPKLRHGSYCPDLFD